MESEKVNQLCSETRTLLFCLTFGMSLAWLSDQYILHDDKGAGDGDTFKFASAASPVTMAGGAYLLLCHCDAGTSPCFDFGIGGTDTITVALDAGPVLDIIALQGMGDDDITYAMDSTGNFVYTTTATPGSVNTIAPLRT